MNRALTAIANRPIGPGHPCFVIAEAGVNHNGDMDMALRLIDIAADAGCDAVKFQTFITEKEVSPFAPKADYQIANTGADESQLEMLKGLELDEAAHRRLMEHCDRRGILFLSSPFDMDSVALLGRLELAAIKIPSGEITNIPYLQAIAALGRPIILSTGMSTLAEVGEALELLRRAGDPPVALLHCLSCYPADPTEVNLRAMDSMAHAYQVTVGYSDHTLGTSVAVAAVARGAAIIEKHITLDHDLPGPDHRASLEPDELQSMMTAIRVVERALGDGLKRVQPSEANTRDVARKSVCTSRVIAAGQTLRDDDLIMLRPGTGFPARDLPLLTGRRSRRDLPAGWPLTAEDLE
ncbi:N-acetylneuraminate synthase [Magnetospirillum sp. 64-120]|uniref:N-acetylneuraminate synthase n=1 Tax=Magnetospirillum sp. 64-120 TaxID=1895778 RepID=UPI0009297E3D|nr:N-acetylneuraminate synthase [Magnetospirillum sp. 64-120]OJX68182.1 MAG: N-acetylneuraminate synthase [Magnetospirillum sp. 64-120]